MAAESPAGAGQAPVPEPAAASSSGSGTSPVATPPAVPEAAATAAEAAGPAAEAAGQAASVGAGPAEPAGEAPRKKQIKLFGFQFSVSEQGARRALVGASGFLLVLNGLGLPFILPKLRTFLGAPYVPMKRQVVDVLFDRVLPTWASHRGRALPGLRLVDIGSGDGRVVAAAASRGLHAVGYEVNPYLVWWSRFRNRRALTQASGSAEIRWANAWSADLRGTDVVTMYGRPGDGLMERAAAKCEAELPPHAAVVSHFFDIPGWERLLVQDVHGLKLYDLSLRSRPGPGSKASQDATSHQQAS
eukprot:CAMPEP_0175370354 /NCGR_PEP_ID=MMETSP0095-20121207/21164_1 /TAXON_ID=311494 /ORGANISM="Alexandrium monilatum, Strain CCMP3105" /LENGTH=301 /DNA_ID=CAMNT_0016668499 /DNA_START=28 /DNA_END=933 /DNA_ORIENTATION=-